MIDRITLHASIITTSPELIPIFTERSKNMGKILLEDLEFYANHGHFEEERIIGARFLVNLEIDISNEKAGFSDRLEDTFNYQQAYTIVSTEMKQSSALLENIAVRISGEIIKASPLVNSVKIKVAKMNPPLGGSVKAVAVEFMNEREK
jgi:dihydroneopterin aldolase